ncbi:MAG: VOC family protein [Leptolyngbya sp.]|nr:VOC family protein [Leptolyngbya sp.]
MVTPTHALHVALLVSDLAQAEWFYGEVLGLTPAPRPLSFPGQWYQLGTFQLHLMVAAQWQAPRPRPDKWGRNPHLALGVVDLAAMQTRLEAAGCPVQRSASGRAALFTQDPDGNLIELTAVPGTP